MINKIIEDLDVPGHLIYLSQYGSHLYGLNTESSDLDFRGVFIPDKNDVLLKRDVDEYNTELEIENFTYESYNYDDESFEVYVNDVNKIKVDVKLFSIYKFLKLCSKGDTNALDLLFSIDPKTDERYIEGRQQYYGSYFFSDPSGYIYEKEQMCYIWEHRNKLINTNNLTSPITYAHKQAEKYSIKGERLTKLKDVLAVAKSVLTKKDATVESLVPQLSNTLDDKHVRIDILDNKGTKEKYLYVGGVQHQFNLDLQTFIERLETKINKEYTSDRTKNAADGNDWKALSHALRILLQVKELLETGGYSFPCKDANFLKDVKLGKVSRESIDKYFNENLENILQQVREDKLGWRYDEDFWNTFLLKVL